jgi:hypothetical protein
LKKKRKQQPQKLRPMNTPPSRPPTTYPSSLSSPVPIDGILYFVCTVTYGAFLDWRYSPLGHLEIDRVLRSCRAIKIWFPKSSNRILTLEKRNVGTIIGHPEQLEQADEEAGEQAP